MSEGSWELTSLGWVGHIPVLPGMALSLQPRVPLHSLFAMLEVAYDLQSFHFLDGLASVQSLPEAYERLAAVLARRVLERIRRGLYRAYLPRKEELPYVRGRIDVRESAGPLIADRVTCRYEEDVVDVSDNQILAWTLRQIAHSGICGSHVQSLVRQAYRRVTEFVTPMPHPASACTGRTYHRLNEDYRLLHALCHFFLEHSGPGHHEGDGTMLPFLVDMGRLYELFVARWLQRHLPQGWTLRAQEQVNLDARQGALRFQPDLVAYDVQGKAWAVLDTKYKVEQGPAPSDVAQVMAYAQSKGCREAVLIYPQPLANALEAFVGEIRVRTLPFALDGPLEAQGQAFLEALAIPAAPSCTS